MSIRNLLAVFTFSIFAQASLASDITIIHGINGTDLGLDESKRHTKPH